MTKLKTGIAGAIVVAGVATPLALQNQSQTRLREENSSLRLQLGQLEKENQRLSNLSVQSKGGQPLPNDQFLELMRLRGEVGQLRNQKNELEWLRGKNRWLRAPQANAPAGQTEPAAEPAAEVLPLVQFEEAPFADVIKTLARQANLTVVLDPTVMEVDQTGVPKYPPVSIRLENVTAENVLEAILSNNNLQLERDPKTQISRVAPKAPG